MPAKKTSPPVEPIETVPPVAAPAPAAPPQPVPLPPLSPSDEKTWAMLAHLSVLLNLVTGYLGLIAAFVIYLVYRDRSRYVASHALQAAIFQSIWWFGGGLLIGVMWAIVGALSAIVIGLVLIPFAVLFSILFAFMPLGAVVYGIIGAVQVSQGRDFEYWLVGDWVRGTSMDAPNRG